MPRTLLDLNFDGQSAFDGSSVGLRVNTSGTVSEAGNTAEIARSTRFRVQRDSTLDTLESFTLEATVRPDRLGKTQVLVDSQTPPVRLSLDRSGFVTGAVHTDDGWQKVRSKRKLTSGKDNRLRLLRDDRGKLILEMNGRSVGSRQAAGKLAATGRAGMSIGSDVKGKTGFAGTIGGVRIIDDALTSAKIRRQKTEATKLGNRIAALYGVKARAELDTGEVDSRFTRIKAIMHAAGVEDLAQLSTLRVTQHTRLTAGTVLKAPAASVVQPGLKDWGALATKFAHLAGRDQAGAKRLIDEALLSRSVGRAVAGGLDRDVREPTPGPGTGGRTTPPVTPVDPRIRPTPPVSPVDPRIRPTPILDTPGPRVPPGVTVRPAPVAPQPPPAIRPLPPGRTVPLMRTGSTATSLSPGMTSVVSRRLTDLTVERRLAITHVEGIERLERNEPDSWPIMKIEPLMLASTILPVDSAVIIAKRLDLTNQTLEIDPSVGTLFIIAEDIEAATGAAITWKRTPLSTPNIGNDPALDGFDRHGVDLAPNSKHGLPGGDARDGAPGIPGYHGQDAPDVEIWALRFNGMPNIDLEGQRGGKGGRGQRGGEGGNGAQGRSGKWYWAFGKRCWDDPGNGGDGGDGGDGGRGGRGGNGGDGGDITFAVLAETLPFLTTTNPFTVNIDGGDAGDGGDGGQRGEGGRGGARGYTEVCDGGRAGARGQPGRVGDRGAGGGEGAEGYMTIMTVTQEAWDEQLTRPWLYDVTPDATLPGTSVVLKGSRFADTDVVLIDGTAVSSTLRADGGLDVSVPTNIGGGEHALYTRRHDGQESNRLPLVVRPQLTGTLPTVVPGTAIPVGGRAFLGGAVVDYDGSLYPATVNSPTSLSFEVPESAGPVSNERSVTLAVVNPDGQRSNTLTGTVPRVLRNGFEIGVHDFSFPNDSDGRPSWGTFEDTFGAVEVWHELLDPVFGHPVLTTAFYFFYEHFLKGEANGGLATGFCTSLASDALNRFWLGQNDTFATVTRDDAFRRNMTAVHGRLLSRESLLDFHDQGRRGNANVVSTFNEIESIFQSGGIRETAPMLFFVPAGAAWDAGYFDMLADSHCIVPIRIVYPEGYDGSSLAGVRMYCWDNNHPDDHECFVDFRRVGGETLFTYTASGSVKFTSEQGITLAVSTLGEYLLRDVDLPFGGPLGLTTFVLDFLLSPATMQTIDGVGRVTGQVGGQILSEIPDSHPAYLVPGAYLMPKNVGLTRRITGTASGTYSFGSLSPDGVSISLSDVATESGMTDRVMTNADVTRVRFVPGAEKVVDMTLGSQIGDVVRGVSIDRFAANPTDDLDVTATPDLSVVRVSNRGGNAKVDVKLLGFDMPSRDRASLQRARISVPGDHDLVIAVTDWEDLTDENVTTSVVEM